MIETFGRAGMVAFAMTVLAIDVAAARSARAAPRPAASVNAYDGNWGLTIVTERGRCDASYHFQVQINSGYVLYTGPARSSGRVAPSGAVHVTVSSGQSSASGSGRLTRTTGSGRWTGRSGNERCSGRWTAQRY